MTRERDVPPEIVWRTLFAFRIFIFVLFLVYAFFAKYISF